MKTRTVWGLLISFSFLLIIGLQVLIMFVILVSRVDDGNVAFGRSIAVIEIKGMLLDATKIVENLEKAEKNSLVKGIVLKVNSPGGAIGPSQEIYDKILEIRKKKPVAVSIQGLGASGAYYLAAAADYIVAGRGSITGSIGVIFQTAQFERALDKLGIGFNTIKSGELKDAGTFTREMTEKEKKYMQHIIDSLYHQFVRDIAVGRIERWKQRYPDLKTVPSQAAFIAKFRVILQKYLDGRALTGEEAFAAGFVDELGNFDSAVRWVSRRTGLDSEHPSLIYYREKKPGAFQLLGQSLFGNRSVDSTFALQGCYYLLKW